MDPLIYKLRGVTRRPESRVIVDIDHLDIHAGELLCVLGPSGAGKSSLLRMLNFSDPPDSGTIEFEGQVPTYQPQPTALIRRIGTVFQRPFFLQGTVRDNIVYPLRLRKINNDDRISAIMDHLEIASLADAQINTLSGGEMQRVALARILVYQPEVILMDEPTANLDPRNGAIIEAMILDEHQRGRTIVMVTHNIFQAKRIAQRVALMMESQIIELAGAAEFFDTPKDPRAQKFLSGDLIY
jgi:tungstate transport system ATP-binding protein